MKISIVIINWNNSLATQKCIQSLISWKDIETLIWIVDNASQLDPIGNKNELSDKIRYIFNSVNRGFAGGNNTALNKILDENMDAVLLLNNDAIISEENVKKLIASFDMDQKLRIVGPLIYEQDSSKALISMGGRDISRHIYTSNYITKLSSLPPDKLLVYVDYVPGTAVLIKTDLFKLIGSFDENYFFSGEMADFCERTRRKGFTCAVNVTSSATHHFDSKSKIRQTLYLYYNLRNRFLFISKFYSSKKTYLYSSWIIYGIFMLIRALAKFQRKKAKATLLALIHGLSGKFGNQNDKILP
jgi:GT2 family glycosyltransferase